MTTVTRATDLLRIVDLSADELARESVASAVIDGPQSAVWQQAANRLPTEQAALYALTTGDWEV